MENAVVRQITQGSRQASTVVVDTTVHPIPQARVRNAIRRALGTHGDRLNEILVLMPEGRAVRWTRET